MELKADWPEDSNKAARRIAGHCNASTGDHVLWLIGVEEVSGVVGANPTDMATWWSQVKSEFDGQAPYILDVSLSLAAGVVVALIFETDRAPFVVRNTVHGLPGGGPVVREVPWREGTSVRSATRSDLLRLLTPTSELPALEIYKAEASLWLNAKDGNRLIVTLAVYAVVSLGAAVVLPNHQAHGTFHLVEQHISGDLETYLEAGSQSLDLLFVFGRNHPSDSRTHTVHQGDRQVLLEGPGFFRFIGSFQPLSIGDAGGKVGPLEVVFSARPAGSDLSTMVQATLLPCAEPAKGGGSQALFLWA